MQVFVYNCESAKKVVQVWLVDFNVEKGVGVYVGGKKILWEGRIKVREGKNGKK